MIERIFGVLKREFKMAREPCEYSIDVQCRIPFALTLLHNFLRVHEPERFELEVNIPLRDEPIRDLHGDVQPAPAMAMPQSEDDRASIRRDRIADEMWRDYQLELAHRRSGRT